MAEQYIKKIRTASGDLQIDYLALANLPTVATQSDDGLMSATDKVKIDNIKNSHIDVLTEDPTSPEEGYMWILK